MNRFPRRLTLIALLPMLMLACHRNEGDKTVVRVTPAAEVLDTFSKVVKLKDRFFVRTESLLEVQFTWVVDRDFKADRDYRVAVHFVNDRGDIVWQADHDPTPPVTSWQPGSTIQYRRVFMVPAGVSYPQINMMAGLYDPHKPDEKIYWTSKNQLKRKDTVCRFFVQPDEREVYKRGWARLEYSADGMTQWRWMADEATFSFRNPRKIAFLALSGGTIRRCYKQDPQLTLLVNGKQLAVIPVSGDRFDQQFELQPALLGDAEWIDLTLKLDKTFVPSECGMGDDTRRLGVMINTLRVSENKYLEGFYPPEKMGNAEWRWIADHGTLQTGNPRSPALLYITGGAPIRQLAAPPEITIMLNGAALEKFSLIGEDFTRVYELAPEQLGSEELLKIDIVTSQSFIPKEKEVSTDIRRLGLMVKDVVLNARKELRK